MAEVKGSPSLGMGAVDWKAVGIQFALALAAFVLTYITEHIGDWDFGDWTGAVMVAWRTFMTFVGRWIPDTRKTP